FRNERYAVVTLRRERVEFDFCHGLLCWGAYRPGQESKKPGQILVPGLASSGNADGTRRQGLGAGSGLPLPRTQTPPAPIGAERGGVIKGSGHVFGLDFIGAPPTGQPALWT